MTHLQSSHLTGCTVGYAGTLIAGQVEIGGTGTLVAPSRREEAKVTAAAIVCLTWMVEH